MMSLILALKRDRSHEHTRMWSRCVFQLRRVDTVSGRFDTGLKPQMMLKERYGSLIFEIEENQVSFRGDGVCSMRS